jgi:hypothetical protein
LISAVVAWEERDEGIEGDDGRVLVEVRGEGVWEWMFE